jgi:outer membrane immunogenic protein
MLSAVALLTLGLAVPADAADLPARTYTKAPPMVAPVYNWSGFYVGLNAGGIGGTLDPDYASASTAAFSTPDELVFLRGFTNRSLKTAGFTGGGQAGYNYQLQNFVLGAEADLNYTGLRQTRVSGPFGEPACSVVVCTVTQSYNADWLATVRGRAGFASNAWLIYATGGLAIAEVRRSDVFVLPTSINAASDRSMLTGWTAGIGVEWAFAPNWSVKAEYLYVDLGSASYTLTNATLPAATFQVDHRLTENVGRIGINYHFSGPVVARY